MATRILGKGKNGLTSAQESVVIDVLVGTDDLGYVVDSDGNITVHSTLTGAPAHLSGRKRGMVKEAVQAALKEASLQKVIFRD